MNEKLTIGSCFSGIGGLELGLEWTGQFETKWQIEWDDYASRVLAKHWPNVTRYKDIRDVVRPEPVDLICGGYPCQPFSMAGSRKGENDPRHLWPELLRLICDLRPKFALMENVAGHLSLGFGRVIGDLAEIGYDAEWQVLSARQFGALHLRRRVFILGYPKINPMDVNGIRKNTKIFRPGLWEFKPRRSGNNQTLTNEQEPEWTVYESRVGGMVDGVPNRVERLKCCGNAVVPQVAQRIGEMILKFKRQSRSA